MVGGGTAGYFAALAVKRRFPGMDVTLIESKSIPIIGVGEATTTLMPPFLHAQLGLDVVEMWKRVKPTLKLGIRFEWGLSDPEYYFAFPFDATHIVEAAAHGTGLHTQSFIGRLMHEGRSPVLREADGRIASLLGKCKFAYHLDNAPFVAFLADAAAKAGIRHEEMTIAEIVRRADGGVEALRGDGQELRHDFYVDASGFGSLVLGKAMGTQFRSFASSLFCDRAVVSTVPQGDAITPYTTAETMDAGWCWRIPVVGADHRGYVYASAFLDQDAAVAEMRAKNPRMGDPWFVKFRSGRHEQFWRANVVAVGNAYGFVEPLESTALHMVIVELAYLTAGLAAATDVESAARFRAYANEAIGAHWDFLRWFLALHYKFNGRLETPFWKAARSDVDVSGFEHFIDRYRSEGAGPWLDGSNATKGDPAFGLSGIATLLLGQQVPSVRPPEASTTREDWGRRIAFQDQLLAKALPQREALEILHERGDLLRDFGESKDSWCTGPRDRLVIAGPDAPDVRINLG